MTFSHKNTEKNYDVFLTVPTISKQPFCIRFVTRLYDARAIHPPYVPLIIYGPISWLIGRDETEPRALTNGSCPRGSVIYSCAIHTPSFTVVAMTFFQSFGFIWRPI